ncbi:MAG: SDR family NAD(P)-dependent oxidoreductase, partial [Pseudomonadota bacterium]
MAEAERLAGRNILISGGANGAGAASSEVFARHGARVAIIDRDLDAGEALQKRLRAAGHNVIFGHYDISDPDQAEMAVAHVQRDFEV